MSKIWRKKFRLWQKKFRFQYGYFRPMPLTDTEYLSLTTPYKRLKTSFFSYFFRLFFRKQPATFAITRETLFVNPDGGNQLIQRNLFEIHALILSVIIMVLNLYSILKHRPSHFVSSCDCAMEILTINQIIFQPIKIFLESAMFCHLAVLINLVLR